MDISRSRVIAIGLGVATAALVFVLWPRTEESPKERIERQVIQMARAAEERELGKILEHVSEDFRSAQGWGKQELKSVLAAQVLRGSWVRVFPVNLEVNLTDPSTAEFRGSFIFGRAEAARPQDLPKGSDIRAYGIDGKLVKESDGQWRFVTANHRVVDPTDLF